MAISRALSFNEEEPPHPRGHHGKAQCTHALLRVRGSKVACMAAVQDALGRLELVTNAKRWWRWLVMHTSLGPFRQGEEENTLDAGLGSKMSDGKF